MAPTLNMKDLPEPNLVRAHSLRKTKHENAWILMGTGSRDSGRLQQIVEFTPPEKGHVHIKGSVDGWRKVNRFYLLPLWSKNPTS